jgi:hypothetical protein
MRRKVVVLVVSSSAVVGLIRLLLTWRARQRVKNNAEPEKDSVADGPMVRIWNIDCPNLESHISVHTFANL